MTKAAPATTPTFCNECGTKLVADALFCHECGRSLDGTRGAAAAASGMSNALKWGFPAFAVLALVALSVIKSGSRGGEPVPSDATPLGTRPMQAPDISSMSPEEQADRLFDRVMRLSGEGKRDSAAFFGTMALGALEALAPLDAHRRYDLGLVALVMGDEPRARAQADTILAQNGNHLLGLSLAARAAEARNDAAAAATFRRRLVAAEPAERARALPEYTDHAAEIKTALDDARNPGASPASNRRP